MSKHVCMSAMLRCSFGAVPSPLLVLPRNRKFINGVMPAATIMDNKPLFNVISFGMCSFTTMPCIPALVAPWLPSYPTITLNGEPLLTDQSKLICTVNPAAEISVLFAGQPSVNVG